MKGLARFSLCSLVGILSYAGPVSATLIFDGFQDLTGTSLGAVNTVLTVQSPANSTDAQGCVGRLGGCPGGALNSTPSDPLRIIGGSLGGNELTGDAQTKTILGSTLGITSANDLRIVFNPSEPGSAAQRGIVLEELRLTIYNPDGSVQFNSGAFSGFEIDDATGGVGQAGWFFKLDSAQATAAGSIDANDRIGLSVAVSGTDGAPETFFLTSVSGGGAGNGNGVATETGACLRFLSRQHCYFLVLASPGLRYCATERVIGKPKSRSSRVCDGAPVFFGAPFAGASVAVGGYV